LYENSFIILEVEENFCFYSVIKLRYKMQHRIYFLRLQLKANPDFGVNTKAAG